MINKILSSANIFELRDNLTSFLNKVDLTLKDYRKLYNDLQAHCEKMIYILNDYKDSKWSFVDGPTSSLLYLYQNWNLYNKSVLNAQQVQEIITEIDNTFLPCSDYSWDKNVVDIVMNLLDEKYNFINNVIGENYLKLIALNCQHKDLNAFIRSYTTNTEKCFGDIYLTEPHDWCKDTQSEILLHELGHLVNIHLTGDVNLIPKSFIEVFKNDFDNLYGEEAKELFANCFAIAVLSNHKLKESYSTKDFNNDLILKLDTYFKMMINPELVKGVLDELLSRK